MATAEHVNLSCVDSWMNDIYEKPKKIELSETKLMALRTMKSMGNEIAAQKLADYYLSRPIF